MTEAPIPQPFELTGIGSSSRVFGGILIILAIVLGGVAYGLLAGHFERPAELATLPLDMMCGGGALLFFVVGLRAYCSRRLYRVDPVRQTMQRLTGGVFGTHYDEEIPFNQLAHVGIVREARGSHDKKTLAFPVYVHLKNGDRRQVCVWDRYPAARVRGERLAKTANVELHDDSEPGETQVRTPAELDQTIGEKLRTESSQRSSPSAPIRMHAKLQPRGDTLFIEIPRFDLTSLGPMKKAVWVVLALFGGWMVVAWYFGEYFVSLVGAIFAGAILYGVLRSETIVVSRDTLAVSAGIFFLRRTRKIPLAELVELFLHNATNAEDEESAELLEQG
ncbi:MAG: hypothetical protein AB7G75_08095, partial [Candidatus Binatia bacterium]